jgi:hypothetical protein
MRYDAVRKNLDRHPDYIGLTVIGPQMVCQYVAVGSAVLDQDR